MEQVQYILIYEKASAIPDDIPASQETALWTGNETDTLKARNSSAISDDISASQETALWTVNETDTLKARKFKCDSRRYSSKSGKSTLNS